MDSSILDFTFYLFIPALAVFFLYGSVIAYRTFGEFNFDSGVLLIGFFINSLAIVAHYLCNHHVMLITAVIQASLMTIMLYYIVAIVNKYKKQGLGFGSLICSFNIIVLLGVFVDQFV